MNPSEFSSKRNFSMKSFLIFWRKKPNCLASQQSQLLNCAFWINSMLCVYCNYVYNYNICIILQPTEKTLDQLPMATGVKFKPFPRVLRALYEVGLTTSVNSILHHGPCQLSCSPVPDLGTFWTLCLLLLPKGCACSLSLQEHTGLRYLHDRHKDQHCRETFSDLFSFLCSASCQPWSSLLTNLWLESPKRM